MGGQHLRGGRRRTAPPPPPHGGAAAKHRGLPITTARPRPQACTESSYLLRRPLLSLSSFFEKTDRPPSVTSAVIKPLDAAASYRVLAVSAWEGGRAGGTKMLLNDQSVALSDTNDLSAGPNFQNS